MPMNAAMLGLLAAFIGLYAGHRLGIPERDGIASLAIGGILAGVAMFLAYESKGLLIGESVHPETAERVRALVDADPAVQRLVRAFSMHLGPRDVLLTLEIEFLRERSAAEVAGAIDRIDKRIREHHPEFRHVFIEAQSIAQKAGPAA